MKLKFSTKILLLAILLTAVAVLFVAFAFNHPELSFPFSMRLTMIIYAVYVSVTVLLYVLAILLKKFEKSKR